MAITLMEDNTSRKHFFLKPLPILITGPQIIPHTIQPVERKMFSVSEGDVSVYSAQCYVHAINSKLSTPFLLKV